MRQAVERLSWAPTEEALVNRTLVTVGATGATTAPAVPMTRLTTGGWRRWAAVGTRPGDESGFRYAVHDKSRHPRRPPIAQIVECGATCSLATTSLVLRDQCRRGSCEQIPNHERNAEPRPQLDARPPKVERKLGESHRIVHAIAEAPHRVCYKPIDRSFAELREKMNRPSARRGQS